MSEATISISFIIPSYPAIDAGIGSLEDISPLKPSLVIVPLFMFIQKELSSPKSSNKFFGSINDALVIDKLLFVRDILSTEIINPISPTAKEVLISLANSLKSESS